MIPEAAVEAAITAAAKAAWSRYGVRSEPGYIRTLLEAAAPHMTRDAKSDSWDEGYVTGYQDRGRESQGAQHRTNPYGPTP